MELWQLQQLQSLPLEAKIIKTKMRIREWYDYWDADICVSFSGGKDSTVLLHIVRELYPDVPAVFVDTGLEYPEIRDFVKTIDNVVWLKPKISFREVIKKYGWNYPSKDVANMIYYAKRGSRWALNTLQGLNPDGSYSDFKQRYKKWQYLIDAPFIISNKCCLIMKEEPLNRFHKEKKLNPIIATMASESQRRKNSYLKTGCNAFNSKIPISKPLSFWTEQDILTYIKTYEIPYASIYGDIIQNSKGQLETTGEQRTGCMFCPVGCHLEKEPNKFQRMKITHPKIYEYCMKPIEEGGLGLSKVLDYIGVKY